MSAATFSPLLEELVLAGATDSELEDEGFTVFEVTAVRAILAGETPADRASSLLGPGTGVVQVELRASGLLLGSGWSEGSNYWEGLRQALGEHEPGVSPLVDRSVAGDSVPGEGHGLAQLVC